MSKILNDKYRLQSVLGVGAFGEVRCASVLSRRRPDSITRYCAIKIMDQNVVQAQKEQFQFELNLLPELSHPHIIRVHEISTSMLYGRFCDDCGCLDFRPSDLSSEQCRNCPHDSRQHCKQFQGRPVTLIVQDLCAAGDLFVLLVRSGAFPEGLSRLYFKQLILGLEFLHLNGIIHRDVKPSNICFDADFRLKIIDFGSAGPSHEIGYRLDYEGHYENRKRDVGSQVYSAPEISVLKETGCCASDVWSAGVILYVLLMKRPPWRRPVSEGRQRDKYFCDLISGFFPSKLPECVTKLLIKIWKQQPAKRLSIEGIKKTEFWQRPVPSKDKVEVEMLERTRLAWIAEDQTEMLHVLNVMRERGSKARYSRFGLRQSMSQSLGPLSISDSHTPSPPPQPPNLDRRPEISIARSTNRKTIPSVQKKRRMQAMFAKLENEPIANIAPNNSSDHKQNYPFPEDLQIDPVIPAKPNWKYGREDVGPQHRRLAKKIVKRLMSWAPNLKVDTIQRRETTRLEVVSTEPPEFEAQILVSDDKGKLLSIRGEGSSDPNLENNLERLMRLLL